MKITTVSNIPGGETEIPHRIELLDRNDGLFSQTLYFRLLLPPVADSLCVSPRDTDLSVSFEPVVYNAINNSRESLKATVHTQDMLVMAQFPLPVHITAIQLQTDKGADSSLKIEIYRVDGDAVSTEPSETASYHARAAAEKGSHARANASTSTHADAALYAKTAAEYDISAFNTPGNQNLALSISSIEYRCSIKGGSFAFRLVTPAGDSVSEFDHTWLSGILVSSRPASPSVSLLAPVRDRDSGAVTMDGSNSFLLATQSAESDSEGAQVPLAMAVKDPFVKALDDTLGRIVRQRDEDSPLDIPIDFALVLTSGAPCAAAVSGLCVEYHCRKKCLIDQGLEKKALKFSGSTNEVQQLNLHLPQASSVIQAVLKVDMALEHRGAAEPDFSSPALEGAAASSQGLEGEAGTTLIQPLFIENACLLHAIQLFLTVLEENTIFSTFLVRGNADSGEAKAVGADISCDTMHPGLWIRSAPAESLILNSGQFHVLVKIHQGRLIWRTAQKPGALVQSVDSQGIRREFRDMEGFFIIEKSLSLAHEGETGEKENILRVKIDGSELPVAEPSAETADQPPASVARYDMRNIPALVSGGDKDSITLSFLANRRGMVTVYAPDMVYDHEDS